MGSQNTISLLPQEFIVNSSFFNPRLLVFYNIYVFEILFSFLRSGGSFNLMIQCKPIQFPHSFKLIENCECDQFCAPYQHDKDFGKQTPIKTKAAIVRLAITRHRMHCSLILFYRSDHCHSNSRYRYSAWMFTRALG